MPTWIWAFQKYRACPGSMFNKSDDAVLSIYYRLYTYLSVLLNALKSFESSRNKVDSTGKREQHGLLYSEILCQWEKVIILRSCSAQYRFFLLRFFSSFRTGKYVLNKILPASIFWCMKGCNTCLSGISWRKSERVSPTAALRQEKRIVWQCPYSCLPMDCSSTKSHLHFHIVTHLLNSIPRSW